MRRFRAALLLMVALTLPASVAGSANNPLIIIAGPGSAATTYYTPRIVSLKGRIVKFRNLDVPRHDVRSNTPGLFGSALIGFGKQTNVNGTQNLARGTYKFFCSLHPNMKGQLIVQ